MLERPVLSVTTRWNLVHTTCSEETPTGNKQQHPWPGMHLCIGTQHPLSDPHFPTGNKKESAGVEDPQAFFAGREKLCQQQGLVLRGWEVSLGRIS